MAKEEKTFLIGDLAEELDVKPATARGLLRNAGIEKDGKQYEWSKTAFDKVVRQLKSKAKEEKAEKPAAKKAGKPAGKKTSKARDNDQDEAA